MTSGPEAVGRLLDRYPNLWTELAIRTDMAPGGKLDPGWRALFLRLPDRILVGTDTWVTARWAALPDYLEAMRVWLRQLPRDVAEKIAHENGERLFAPRLAPACNPGVFHLAVTGARPFGILQAKLSPNGEREKGPRFLVTFGYHISQELADRSED